MRLFDRASELSAPARADLVAEVRAQDADIAEQLRALLSAEVADDPLVSHGGRIDLAEIGATFFESTFDSTGEAIGDSTGEAIRTRDASPRARARARARDAGELGVDTLALTSDPDECAASVERDQLCGTVIADRYRLEQFLGAGGMGEVYRASDEEDGNDVAVKLLRADVIDDPHQVQRFRREFRAIARVQHPGCLSVFAEGQHQGRRYIVMEYVPGGNLGRLIGAPTEVLLPVLIQLANALDCVHRHRIVHRDLKPENVLLAAGAPPQPKLADFGIVKLVDDRDTQLTATGRLLGTIDYIAPERLDGSESDPRSDLYSLGCVLYKLWAGHVPFQGNLFQRLRGRLDGEVPRLSSEVPEVPTAIDDLVAQLLRHDPSERPQRAGDVASVLAELWQRERREVVSVPLVESGSEGGPGGFLYRPGVIGRESALAELTAAVTAARTSPTAYPVALGGVGGVGKSALVAELARAEARVGHRVITAPGRSDADTPFGPFPAVLAEVERLLTRDPDRAPDRDLPHTLALPHTLDRPRDHARSPEPDPPGGQEPEWVLGRPPPACVPLDDAVAARRRFAGVLADRLWALHHRRPTTLVLEDVHEATPGTLALIFDLLSLLDRRDDLDTRPVVVVTARPSARATLTESAGDRAPVWIELAALDRAAVAGVAAAMLAVPATAMPERLVTHLSEACAGNPLLVQSTVRALVEHGHLRLEPSGWRLDRRDLTDRLSDALADVLGHHLDSLTPSTRDLLSLAAVCGDRFDVALLQRLAEANEDDVLDALDEALRAAVIVGAGPGGYRFEHERLAQAARARLDDDALARAHRIIGAALADRGQAPAATLAWHFGRGGERGRACGYHHTAGEEAFGARDYEAAQRHLQAALESTDALAEDEREPTRQACAELLADAMIAGGQARAGAELLHPLAAIPAAPVVRARRLRKLGLALTRTDDVSAGLAALEQALARLDDPVPRGRRRLIWRAVCDATLSWCRWLLRRRPAPDPATEERAIIHRELAFMYRWIDLARLWAHQSAFIRLAYRLGAPAYRAEAHVGAGFLRAMLPWSGRAAHHHQRARALLEEGHETPGLARLELVRGGIEAVLRGDADAACAHFDRGVQLADEVGDRFLASFAHGMRGWGVAVLGHGRRAGADFERAQDLADAIAVPWLAHDAACGRALVDVFRGRGDHATRTARRILGSDLCLTMPVFEGLAHELLGVGAFIDGRFRDAVRAFDHARDHYSRHRLRYAWGHTHKQGYIEALLGLADQEGEGAVPELATVLRRQIRKARVGYRDQPRYRGYELLLRGIQAARRGQGERARRLFDQVEAVRVGRISPDMSAWYEARIAFERLRLGDPRAEVIARLDQIDRRYDELGLVGMQTWLGHMRALHGV